GLAIQQILNNWRFVGASTGTIADRPVVLGVDFYGDAAYYWLAAGLTALAVWAVFNLERSHVGRAFRAVRDADLAAQMSGIGLAKHKTLAFVVSAGIAGLAGAIYGPLVGYLTPESFNLLLSVKFLLMTVIGGLGLLPGALLGAGFIAGLEIYLATFRAWSQLVFGLVVILVLVLEPAGLDGCWLKVRRDWKEWPTRDGSGTDLAARRPPPRGWRGERPGRGAAGAGERRGDGVRVRARGDRPRAPLPHDPHPQLRARRRRRARHVPGLRGVHQPGAAVRDRLRAGAGRRRRDRGPDVPRGRQAGEDDERPRPDHPHAGARAGARRVRRAGVRHRQQGRAHLGSGHDRALRRRLVQRGVAGDGLPRGRADPGRVGPAHVHAPARGDARRGPARRRGRGDGPAGAHRADGHLGGRGRARHGGRPPVRAHHAAQPHDDARPALEGLRRGRDRRHEQPARGGPGRVRAGRARARRRRLRLAGVQGELRVPRGDPRAAGEAARAARPARRQARVSLGQA